MGEKVDLDNLYWDYCDKRTERIDHLTCIKELGYALYYMEFSHPDINFGGQWVKIKDLCRENERLWKEEGKGYLSLDKEHGYIPPKMQDKWDKIWFKFHYKITDETENMC